MTTPLVTAAYPRNNSDSCGGGRSRELFDDAYVKQVLEESPNAKFTPGDDFGEDLFIPESLAAEESAAAAETSAVAAVAAAKAVSGGCDHHSGALLRKFNVAFFVPSYIQVCNEVLLAHASWLAR